MNASSPFAVDWLMAHAARAPLAPCLGTPSGWLSYGEVAGRVRLAAALLARQGVAAGERVMLALPNGPAAVVASLAVQSCGGCAVEVSREWGAEALRAIAEQTQARHAVIAGRDAALWAAIHAPFRRIWIVHPAPPPPRMCELLAPAEWTWVGEDGAVEAGHAPAPPAVLDADAPALLIYTSGSTGRRLGVVQTHRNIAANTRSICEFLQLGPADRVLSILPLYHCYGKSLLQTHLLAGGSVFFDHRFTYPRVVMEAMAQQACTGFAGVPLTFELLRRQGAATGADFPALRYVTQAGGPMQADTVRWARAAFAPARLYVMYGQTEATARLSYLPPESAQAKEGSIGRGIAGVELRVLDEDGRECATGQVGQLAARGDNVTKGYYNDEEATRQILRHGWLWTGDLAYRDADGYIFITGRAKDILKIRGHRIGAAEIERCLCRHPDVSEAAVVGVPDAVEGESAAAFVVLRAGAEADENALRKFCREQGSAYAVPRTIRFEAVLPRTTTGKIAKGELKTKVLQ